VQVETCKDISLLRSGSMVPFKSHNKIIPGTPKPHNVNLLKVVLALEKVGTCYTKH